MKNGERSHLSIEFDETKQVSRQLKDDKYNKYHREYARTLTTIQLTAKDAKEMKLFLYEYNTWCQQNLVHEQDLHHFLMHFTKIGFNEWRSRTKGK
jgi:protein tyrosine phosphatase